MPPSFIFSWHQQLSSSVAKRALEDHLVRLHEIGTSSLPLFDASMKYKQFASGIASESRSVNYSSSAKKQAPSK
jgi:hypothetical protein